MRGNATPPLPPPKAACLCGRRKIFIASAKNQINRPRLMSLPYKIATLLYCFNEQDETLLLKRTQKPNLGRWSPCGGKLHMDDGESPHACACREAAEEIGLKITPQDLH